MFCINCKCLSLSIYPGVQLEFPGVQHFLVVLGRSSAEIWVLAASPMEPARADDLCWVGTPGEPIILLKTGVDGTCSSNFGPVHVQSFFFIYIPSIPY